MRDDQNNPYGGMFGGYPMPPWAFGYPPKEEKPREQFQFSGEVAVRIAVYKTAMEVCHYFMARMEPTVSHGPMSTEVTPPKPLMEVEMRTYATALEWVRMHFTTPIKGAGEQAVAGPRKGPEDDRGVMARLEIPPIPPAPAAAPRPDEKKGRKA